MGALEQSDPALAQSSLANDNDNAAEWEYEYDEREFEDFYLTIQIPTTATETSSKRMNGKHVAAPPTTASMVRRGTEDLMSPFTSTQAEDNDEVLEGDRNNLNRLAQLQILDLHTPNPLIKLDEAVYSCSWSTAVGTDVYVSSAGVTPSPLRPGHTVDLIALSRSRLAAQRWTIRVGCALRLGKAYDLSANNTSSAQGPPRIHGSNADYGRILQMGVGQSRVRFLVSPMLPSFCLRRH